MKYAAKAAVAAADFKTPLFLEQARLSKILSSQAYAPASDNILHVEYAMAWVLLATGTRLHPRCEACRNLVSALLHHPAGMHCDYLVLSISCPSSSSWMGLKQTPSPP